jgi:hypothetical protein
MKRNSLQALIGADALLRRPTISVAELMDDSAVYKRTSEGQRALLRSADFASQASLRILARCNGYTELRRLIDLSPADAQELVKAIQQLHGKGLIELVVNLR